MVPAKESNLQLTDQEFASGVGARRHESGRNAKNTGGSVRSRSRVRCGRLWLARFRSATVGCSPHGPRRARVDRERVWW